LVSPASRLLSRQPPAAARWLRVASVKDVPPDAVRSVRVAGRRIVLINRAGRFFALDAVCPHAGGPLDEGELYHGTLECPWHRFRYNPRTGKNVYPANVYPDDMPRLMEEIKPVQTFRVKREGKDVLVWIEDCRLTIVLARRVRQQICCSEAPRGICFFQSSINNLQSSILVQTARQLP
ncbi:MAG: Rieske (2Fe-2S) protein, partial [Terriglobales bacterium]